ncbi:hypothetical protein ZWY2020_046898 [Hordeum vulgare]|nr:hypothetical protein ZWY2020_046898 [Hordeum vulgare]
MAAGGMRRGGEVEPGRRDGARHRQQQRHQAIVEELAGHGARVHTCARSAAELEECRRRWEAKGSRSRLRLRRLPARQRRQLVETVKQSLRRQARHTGNYRVLGFGHLLKSPEFWSI